MNNSRHRRTWMAAMAVAVGATAQDAAPPPAATPAVFEVAPVETPAERAKAAAAAKRAERHAKEERTYRPVIAANDAARTSGDWVGLIAIADVALTDLKKMAPLEDDQLAFVCMGIKSHAIARTGKYNEAIEYLEKEAAAWPWSSPIMAQRVILWTFDTYRKAGRAPEGMAKLRQFAEAGEPAFMRATAWGHLCRQYDAQEHNRERAVQAGMMALTESPGTTSVRQALAMWRIVDRYAVDVLPLDDYLQWLIRVQAKYPPTDTETPVADAAATWAPLTRRVASRIAALQGRAE